MSNLDKVRDTVHLLSQNFIYYTLTDADYPSFAQFLRLNYLESPTRDSKLTNDQRRVLSQYERALALYWCSFPDQLKSHPLVKDISFFFLCLFEISNDLDHFLVNFHRYVFYAPKFLTENDLCLLKYILSFQSDKQLDLINACDLNKNTVSSRVRRFYDAHILAHRRRVAFEAFGLVPYILLSQHDGHESSSSFLMNKGNPWLFTEYIGTENQHLTFYLLPNSLEGSKEIENLKKELASRYSAPTYLLRRFIRKGFISYNIDLFNLSQQTWDFFLDSSDPNRNQPSILWPFQRGAFDSFKPNVTQLKILNYYQQFPTATQREVCKYLKISSATLVHEINEFTSIKAVKWVYGIYPFDLPEFASFFLELNDETEIISLIKELAQRTPIIQGGIFTGDFNGVDLHIPFLNTQEILNFRTSLEERGYEIKWFQVNHHPFASRWMFPIDLWIEKLSSWQVKT
jgi:hypothetical protein